jgi:ribosomal protein S18 acetylase RimI-like enzyme
MHEKYFTDAGIQNRTRKTDMSIILQNLASPAIEEAIEANFTEEMANLGYGLPDGELHKTPELLWIFTGSHGPNAVLYSRFASDDPSYVDTKIDEMIGFFQTRNIDFGWTTGLSTRPTDLGSMLEAHGFVYSDSTTGMAIDLQELNEHILVNAELAITEIEDLETLKILRSIEIVGFGASETAAQRYYDSYAHTGFGNGTPWHHYIGWLHGEPVAIASLLFHAGVAGIYGVATIPESRRQGVAAAMTLHALHEAHKVGYRIAVLSPTEMSYALYRRIGFQEYCKLMHYEWSART